MPIFENMKIESNLPDRTPQITISPDYNKIPFVTNYMDNHTWT